MEAVLSSRACPPGVEEVGGEGKCHVWSVVPQAQGYSTVSTLQRITNSNCHDIYITFFFYTHFAPHNFVFLKIDFYWILNLNVVRMLIIHQNE